MFVKARFIGIGLCISAPIEGAPLENRMKTPRPLQALLLALAVAAPQPALAADPAGSGPVVNALAWLQGTLLGNVATAVAVIAVAMVGFMMLTGRMNWRFGATVIIGCFILFGAASIVAGIQSTAGIAR
jgi:type IV secretory pathway VirB2 component (pilin)